MDGGNNYLKNIWYVNMNFFIFIKSIFKQLALDIKDLLIYFFSYVLKEFNSLDQVDKVILGAGFLTMVTLALPMFVYQIFGDQHKMYHPHFYLAPLGYLIIFAGCVLEFPRRKIVKLIGLLPFLIIFVTLIFPRLTVPGTIPEFTFTPGFWIEIISIIALSASLLFSLKE
jgi:hypothetical protein